MAELPQSDLEEVLEVAEPAFRTLHGERLFLTGGTGFFGRWLLESLQHATQRLDIGVEVVALTRNPPAFAQAAPHLAGQPWLTLFPGDVRSFDHPSGQFGYMIHGAADVSGASSPSGAVRAQETIAVGTERVFEFAQQAGLPRSLHVSSGAVYGPQPPAMDRIPEEYSSDAPVSPYGEGKRAAERIANEAGATLARCFAFSGPLFPLEGSFALGNFVRDGLNGGPIRVAGDGTALRSYLYAADLAAWLWTMLTSGEAGRAYNVGSPEPVSMAGLAQKVASVIAPSLRVEVANERTLQLAPNRYVPSVDRAKEELHLVPRVSLEEGLRRMVEWYRHHPPGQVF